MSEFAQGRYLILRPTRLITEDDIASNLSIEIENIEYVDPTVNQASSDFYDDLGAAYTAKLDEFIQWDNLQVFLIAAKVKSTFFILKESEMFLGSIELSFETAKKLRELRLVMDKFQFFGTPKTESDKKRLEDAKVEISKLITNSW